MNSDLLICHKKYENPRRSLLDLLLCVAIAIAVWGPHAKVKPQKIKTKVKNF